MKIIIYALFFCLISTCCTSKEEKQRKKIVGTWTIEKIEGKNPDSNLYEGALISFTNDGVFRAPRVKKDSPRTGKWYIVQEDKDYMLKIESSNPYISGTYNVNAFSYDNPNPHNIKIVPVGSDGEIYLLSKLSTDLNDFLD